MQLKMVAAELLGNFGTTQRLLYLENIETAIGI